MKREITHERPTGENDYKYLPESPDETITFSGGFHNSKISVPFTEIESYICRDGYRIDRTTLRESDAKQVNSAACGMSDCSCGSGISWEPLQDGLVLTYSVPDEMK